MELTSGQPAIQVGGNGDGFGNCGFGMMFLAFLAIAAMNGGGMWGGHGGVPNNVATTDTVNQAMNYSNLQQQNGQIMAEVQRSQNASMMFGADKYMELQRDIANNGSQIQAVLARLMECCCTLQRQMDAQTLDFTKQGYEARINNDKQFCELRESMNKQFCELNRRMDLDENRRLREEVDNLKDDMRMFRIMGNFSNRNGNDGCCGNGGWLPGFNV